MCGIVGLARPELGRVEGERLIAAMCATIVHRGPDGAGCFVEPGIGLGMRRLSIIDVVGGQQPMGNEDGQIQVVFNGEIYNHRMLRRRLEQHGHRFRTRSDTEVIVHGYEEWGDDVLHQLRGMFGFALWDRRMGRLLLARDRLGIKPVYVWRSSGGVAFASELKALRVLPDFPREIDPLALTKYLAFGYVPEPLSIWRGVSKLGPGEYLTWSREGGIELRTWWSPLRGPLPAIDESEAVTELRRLLSDAVSCHLESDVPLGAFLSGGVDSSAVVAQMQRLLDRPVQTFSIGFAEAEFNEAPQAALVAAALGTRHTEEVLSPDIDALADELVLSFDEPFADSSALPTWLVSRLARKTVTVALSGDGGDELFAGYTRYAEVLRGRALPAMAGRAAGLVGRRLPASARGRAFLLNAARSPEGRFAATVALPLLPEEGGVVRRGLLRGDARLEHLLDELFSRTRGHDLGTRMALVDVMSYLPGDILTKVDRMSMKVSLEARVPLLDHELAEFALRLPHSLKRRQGVTKWVFRRAVEPLVPRAVLSKPKQGFGVPFVHWLRGPLRHRLDGLAEQSSPVYRFCDAGATERILAEHRTGRRDHSTQLWRLLVLETWLRRFAA
jgi:asparagine synthase (glutamine-hydrolysing)